MPRTSTVRSRRHARHSAAPGANSSGGAATYLLRLADLIERDIGGICRIDTLDMGAPITRTRAVDGRPPVVRNLNRGYFVRPTVFAGVRNDMTIAAGGESSVRCFHSITMRQTRSAWQTKPFMPGGLCAVRRSMLGGWQQRCERQCVRELSVWRYRGAIRWLQAVRQWA